MNSQEVYLRRVQRGGGSDSHTLRLALRYLIMLFVTVLMVGPFCLLFYISVRMHGNIYTWPSHLSDLSLESYSVVWQTFRIPSAFKNSLIIAIVSVVLTVFVASLAAYPLARYDFYGRNLIFLGLLSTLMIPFQLYMIPLFLLTTGPFALGNTVLGVVLPFCASVFGIYLLKQFYSSVPRDLEEAARVDGAGEFRLWWQIMFPLTKPAVATLAIFTFVGSWSAFLWPLIVLQSEDKQTLPVLLATMTGAFVERTSYLAAGSVIAIAPVIIFFLFLQRFFLGGITMGAVKG